MRLLLNFTKGKIITDEICDIIQDAVKKRILVNCRNDITYSLDFDGKGKDAEEQCEYCMEYIWREFLEEKTAILPLFPTQVFKADSGSRIIAELDKESAITEITCEPYSKEEIRLAKRNANVLEWYFY